MERRRGDPSEQASGTADGNDPLAVAFSEFARRVQHEAYPAETLVEIVRAAVELVPGCDEGSISVVLGRHEVTSKAASGDLPLVVDALQERFGGPCMDAAYEHQTVRVPDMASETRWPRFARAALEAGAGSMLALQLYVEGDDLGALNLFSRRAGAFDDESEHVALLFAAHAAVAYAASRNHAQLARSVVTRHVIGQAQGILMERYKLTDDAAFALLVQVSQHENRKLRALAEQLVQTGEIGLPPAGGADRVRQAPDPDRQGPTSHGA